MASSEHSGPGATPISLLWDCLSGTGTSTQGMQYQGEALATETTGLLRSRTRRMTSSCVEGQGSFEETRDFVHAHQKEIQDEFRAIHTKTTYNYAYKLAPRYVEDLQILFLLAEDWD
jgi:hypothetical protein